MKFGVVIPTYYKKDGSTKDFLEKTIQSVVDQTYTDWKLFIVGDDYTHPEELVELTKHIPPDKLRIENLPVSIERSKYKGRELWLCSGCNPSNQGIKLLEEEGINYYCHLDHEDIWTPQHLEYHNNVYLKYPEVSFVYTKAHFVREGNCFPADLVDDKMNNLPPRGRHVVHSSISFNINIIKLRYRNMMDLKIDCASDADLWDRINEEIRRKNIFSYHVPKATTYHLLEGRCTVEN